MSQQQYRMQHFIHHNSIPQHIYSIPQQQMRPYANQYQPQMSYPQQHITINRYDSRALVDKYPVYNASVYGSIPISHHPQPTFNPYQQIMPLTKNNAVSSLPPNNINTMQQSNQFQPQINKHKTKIYNDMNRNRNEKKQIIDNEEMEEIDDEKHIYIDDSDTDFYDDASNEDENDINDLFIEGDAILAGEYVGIIHYLGPLYLNPQTESEITKEDYIGIECIAETSNDRGHDGFYKGHRYFKTKNNKKTGILIKASKFTKKLSPFMLLENIKKQSDAVNQLQKTIATLKKRNELLSVNVESLLLQQHRIKKLFNKYGLLKHGKLNDINDETLLNLTAMKSRPSNINKKDIKKQKKSHQNGREKKKKHHDSKGKTIPYIDNDNKYKIKRNNNDDKYTKRLVLKNENTLSKLEMNHKTINLPSTSITKQKHHKDIDDDMRILKSYDDYHSKDHMKQLRLLNKSSTKTNDDIFNKSNRDSMFRASINSDINKYVYNIGNKRNFSSITIESIEYKNETETPLLLDNDSLSSHSTNDDGFGTVHYIPHRIQTSISNDSDGESMEWTEGSSDDDGSGIWALCDEVTESSISE